MVFDAHPDETVPGTVSFIAPLATEIEGVAYFMVTIAFDDIPSWIRGGMNADVDITTDERSDTLRLPKRFVTKRDDGSYRVLVQSPEGPIERRIEVPFVGNDGFVAVSGLSEGDTAIAP